MTKRWTMIAAFVAGCGGNGDSDLRCLEGQHVANPDGRGERCIEDSSVCDRASNCAQPGDPCCAAACADPRGTGVYECVQDCDSPECTQGSCPAEQVCQVIDECSAFCVPEDVECADETIAADPTGSGQFICVDADSECLAPGDCAGAAPIDPCCSVACMDAGDALFQCRDSCAGAGAGVACLCTTDADCVRDNGPGWTCEMGGGCLGGCYCAPPSDPSCQCGAERVPVCGVDGLTWDAACGEECIPVEIECEGECPCPDCDCAVGAYVPVCGMDGQTYDAACGEECVPVEIACQGECPCTE
ncbi:MAG: hypothetical protein HYY06_06090 [Deltaproteobacteria bacterium]|nr:hypothetical protein [Deltaproteobacteria bacterium]